MNWPAQKRGVAAGKVNGRNGPAARAKDWLQWYAIRPPFGGRSEPSEGVEQLRARCHTRKEASSTRKQSKKHWLQILICIRTLIDFGQH